MRYEWDEDKRRANLAKHGLDFADVEGWFDRQGAVYGNQHIIAGAVCQRVIGVLSERLVAALVYADRGEVTRIVSLRKATRIELRIHASSNLWHP